MSSNALPSEISVPGNDRDVSWGGDDADIAVSVHNVSKVYRLFDRPQDRLKQAWLRGRKKLYHEFWALKDISFELKKGGAVGIIGRNGSGKSTLLHIIAGTLRPSAGEARVNGRMATILELGSGFNPDFTGRENVFMNGAILGLSRDEMERKFEGIIAFADIGEFINQPVRLYSSGMFVRLAFAVAVHVDADILIVDEALSVGDMEFQGKCIAKLKQFLDDPNRSLLFVSHSIDMVKSICQNSLFLDHGRQVEFGPSEQVCESYMSMMRGYGKTVTVINEVPQVTEASSGTHDPTPSCLQDYGVPEKRQYDFSLHSFQEVWRTYHSGALVPGRYRVTISTKRSVLGGLVSLRGVRVFRHSQNTLIPLGVMAASGGWQRFHEQEGEDYIYTELEEETLQFEFTGHELFFEGLNHSSAGAVKVLIEPIPRPQAVAQKAQEIFRPSEEFHRRVAALRYGSGEARLVNVEILDQDKHPTDMVYSGDEITVRLHMETDIDLEICNTGCVLRDHTGRDLLTLNVFDEQINWPFWRARTPRVVDITFNVLFQPGIYVIAAGISLSTPVFSEGEKYFDFCSNAATFQLLMERSGRPCWGLVRLPGKIQTYV